jgi:hypothetical protein
MGPDDVFDDRQSQTGPAMPFLRGEKRLENLFKLILGHSAPGV